MGGLKSTITNVCHMHEDLMMEPLQIVCYTGLAIVIFFSILLLMLFLGVPCVFRWSTTVQKQAIFLPFRKYFDL